ncbi:hypothetical protein [Endothiovibrio diazotrophicus]
MEDIDSVNEIHQRNLNTELVIAKTKTEFIACLERIRSEASQGEYPIPHIECHGSDNKTGLILGDDQYLSWSELKPFLTAINVATRCNLLIVMASCYGGYLGNIVLPTDRSPCWGFIGPTDSVYPDELLSTFNAFYGKLLDTLNGDESLTALTSRKLSFGGYYFTTSIGIFKHAYSEYLKKYCSGSALEESAKRMYRALRKNGTASSLDGAQRNPGRAGQPSGIPGFRYAPSRLLAASAVWRESKPILSPEIASSLDGAQRNPGRVGQPSEIPGFRYAPSRLLAYLFELIISIPTT